MKKKHKLRISAMVGVLCAAMLLSLMPTMAFAEPSADPSEAVTVPETLEMTAGEVCSDYSQLSGSSSTESVAWVDENGMLNALKEGTADITWKKGRTVVGTTQVTVKPFTEDPVGNLKILVRYNDSMQFYDGHSYLIFTSYKDNVTLQVEDLYAGYEISDVYYKDIRNDISNGSNHTGTDTAKYFTLMDETQKSVTLDRGEVVTIGMYRAFELSIVQAAFAMLKNSSAWALLKKSGKTVAVESLFKLLQTSAISADEAAERLKKLLQESGIKDYRRWIDGKADGGVCFNRELFNQKAEWDQFENTTYDLDITSEQLKRLESTLSGNLNRFSMIGNSCATVLQKAWNAAVGTTEDGEPTAYYLNVKGEGIFSVVDAPKGVRDAVVRRLKGAVKNSSKGYSEGGSEDCGFWEGNEWVYVTAPKKVIPPAEPGSTYKLKTIVKKPSGADVIVSVTAEGSEELIEPGSIARLPAGTNISVRYEIGEGTRSVFSGITVNGEALPAESCDPETKIWTFSMPEENATLNVCFAKLGRDLEKLLADLPIGGLLKPEDCITVYTDGETVDPVRLYWVIPGEEIPILEYTDETKGVMRAIREGKCRACLWMRGLDGEDVCIDDIFVNVYDPETTSYVDFDYNLTVSSPDGNVENGSHVRKGTVLTIRSTPHKENLLLSELTCNGKALEPGEQVTVGDSDLTILAKFRTAKIVLSSQKIQLNTKGEMHQLRADVKYTGTLARYLKVYDGRISWHSSNEDLVEVDENGCVRLVGDVPPEGGEKVTVTANALSGSLFAKCEVEVGDYKGDEIAGKLTIYARTPGRKQLLTHACLIFTPNQDTDLNVSYYQYYEPTEAYKELMYDYEDHPENYPSDPSVYSDEIDLGDRESYFTYHKEGANAEPQQISLKSGESITLSDYSFDVNNLERVFEAFSKSSMVSDGDPDAIKVAEEMQKYLAGEEYDAEGLFDGLNETLISAWILSYFTGHNPIDGTTVGGVTVNQEIHNLFTRRKSEIPNQYYEIEITADEVEKLNDFLSDPRNNYYALASNNCANCVVNLWNTVLSDKPELHLDGSLAKFVVNPDAVYAELVALSLKKGLPGKGGCNLLPKAVAGRNNQITSSAKDSIAAPAAGAVQTASSSRNEQAALNKGCGISVSERGAVRVKWGAVSAADGYDVFVKKGSTAGLFAAKAANVKAGGKTALALKKVSGKKVNPKKKYSFSVKAYQWKDGKKVYIACSTACSANGPKNAKYTNVKKVSVKNPAISLVRGKTARIKAHLTKKAAKKKLDKAAKKLFYFSDDPSVATVSSKGLVLGLKAGSCSVFCMAANGVKTSVKVTVK